MKKNRVKVRCSTCNIEYELPKWDAERCTNHFCRNECRKQWRSNIWKAQNNPRWCGGDIEVRCNYCGKNIKREQNELDRYRYHFCNTICYSEWQLMNKSGENHSQYGTHRSLETRKKISASLMGIDENEWINFKAPSYTTKTKINSFFPFRIKARDD
jgi:hypothetical protein